MLYYYKTISFTFFIANVLCGFLISAIITFGLALVIISLCFFQISEILGIFYKILIQLIIFITEFTSKIPLSKIHTKTPYVYQIILYYILIFGISYQIKSKKVLKYNKQIIATILIIMLLPNIIEVLPQNNLKIYFIDVGQGDACLIVTPQNKKILIDGGGSESYDVR